MKKNRAILGPFKLQLLLAFALFATSLAASAGDNCSTCSIVKGLPNSIVGSWTIADVWSHRTETAEATRQVSALLHKSQNQLQWKITEKSAILEFNHAAKESTPACGLALEFDVSYCCPDMHRIFLRKAGKPMTESTAGCLGTVLPAETLATFSQKLEQALQLDSPDKDPDTYRFVFDVDQLILMGPYWQDPTTDFQTVIRMIPGNSK
jgi:hypothetical protein